MSTAQDLINAEIKRMAAASAIKYGYTEPGAIEECEDEARSELRSSYDQDAIGIEPWGYSRHYECKPVVKRLGDQWVCWLYWYGGGKHGEPDHVEWIEDARIVEEGDPITFKTFKAKEAAA